MAGRLITVSTSVNKKMWVKLSRRVGSFRGYPFVMIFLAGVDDSSSDNWQEVGQDVDSRPDHNHGDDSCSDNPQEGARDIDSGPDHNYGDHGSSDNSQEVGQDIDSGPDHNPVAGRPVPEKEGRVRPNRTKSL